MNNNITTDIDECTEDTDMCDPNAECTNTIGSYNCTCTVGYTGNGRNCGTILHVHNYICLSPTSM